MSCGEVRNCGNLIRNKQESRTVECKRNEDTRHQITEGWARAMREVRPGRQRGGPAVQRCSVCQPNNLPQHESLISSPAPCCRPV
ncbi:hypothetical protein J6590_070875 [Homalodisca vitripennis]|nr:hypothetical protein J6590_070875 [Homalodisca vitripennis]